MSTHRVSRQAFADAHYHICEALQAIDRAANAYSPSQEMRQKLDDFADRLTAFERAIRTWTDNPEADDSLKGA